jgi:single-strand DNA-binding protein
MSTQVTLVGTISEPELRFIPNGSGLVNFSVKVTKPAKEGETRTASYFDVKAWGQLAENIAETFRQGDRVIVVGRIEQETWQDKETNAKKSKIVVTGVSVGPDLSYATAEVTRNERDEPKQKALASF